MFWRTQVHGIYTGSDSFHGFLNTSLDFLIFSSCVKSNTLFIRNCLLLYHSFIQGRFVFSPLKVVPLFCILPRKIKKNCLLSHLWKNHNQGIIYETTKVIIQKKKLFVKGFKFLIFTSLYLKFYLRLYSIVSIFIILVQLVCCCLYLILLYT